MVAETLLFELQNGQLKATSSLGRCFFGGGLDDFLFPIKAGGDSHQTVSEAIQCSVIMSAPPQLRRGSMPTYTAIFCSSRQLTQIALCREHQRQQMFMSLCIKNFLPTLISS